MTDEKKRYLGALVELVENDPAFADDVDAARLVGDVAQRLKRMRIQAGLSQTQMGARLKVSQGRISQIESGLLDYAPNLETIAQYAQVCGAKARLEILAAGEKTVPEEKAKRVIYRKRFRRARAPQSEKFVVGHVAERAAIEAANAAVAKVFDSIRASRPNKQLMNVKITGKMVGRTVGDLVSGSMSAKVESKFVRDVYRAKVIEAQEGGYVAPRSRLLHAPSKIERES